MQQGSGHPIDDSSSDRNEDRGSITTTSDQPSSGSASDHEHGSGPTTDSEKGSSADAVPSLFTQFFLSVRKLITQFLERFGLQKWDFVPIIIVLLLVGVWVYMRGNRAYEGAILVNNKSRPLRVGIVSWPGYAGGLVANNGLRPNKDSDFWIK